MITWGSASGAAAVNVFHEATEYPTATDDLTKKQYAQNPKSTFTFFRLFRLDGVVPGEGPVVGIERRLRQPGTAWALDPLTINLNSLEIGVWTPYTGLQALTYFEPIILIAPRTVLGFDTDYRPNLRLTITTPGTTPAYRPVTMINPGVVNPKSNPQEKRHPDQIILTDTNFRTLLQAPDGWIYLAGTKWWRIDSKTLTAQRLTTQPLPKQYYEGMHYGVSSLFGIIAWNDTECYRVTIDETKIPKTGE